MAVNTPKKHLWLLTLMDGTQAHVWSQHREIATSGTLIYFNHDSEGKLDVVFDVAFGEWKKNLRVRDVAAALEQFEQLPVMGTPPASVRRGRTRSGSTPSAGLRPS